MTQFSGAVEAGLLGGLRVLLDLLDSAAAHAEQQGVDVGELLQAQLYPDMFPFWRQLHSAANVSRRCVDRLTGKELDDAGRPDVTIDALRAHLQQTIAYVKAADGAAIDATESAELSAKLARQAVTLTGRTYVSNFALPNFLFHVVTAYNILRHEGVALGKHGYLRPFVEQGATSA